MRPTTGPTPRLSPPVGAAKGIPIIRVIIANNAKNMPIVGKRIRAWSIV